MSPKFDSLNEETPVNRDWKDYWRTQEKTDPSQKRNVREAKKQARRQIHKRNRKNVKEKLRNWNDEQ